MDKHKASYAKQLDEADILKDFRNEFYLQNDGVYMDGNSLGILSKRAEESTLDILSSWKQHAIDGWTEGDEPWYYLSEKLGEKMAPLVGAKREEVIATGSTTVNLHQLMASFYEPDAHRNKVLADTLNFPSDIYALQTQIRLRGLDPETTLIQVESTDGHTLEEETIITKMTEEVAVIVLPSVLYRSGQVLDMEKLTDAAHARGILIGFDLCHSIGALPHQLHQWGVDFAFWCTYKHLNGGPGSVGGLYVHEKHHGKVPGLAGWFSSNKEKQFDMEHALTPAATAGAYQIGTPHILSAAPLLGALELFHEAGIERIREKSLRLTGYMMELLKEELSDYGFTMRHPRDEQARGAHLYVEHPEAARICKALKQRNIIPDFRKPSGIRLAPVALYNSFSDVYHCVHVLKEIMENQTYEQFSNERDVIA